MSEIITDSFKLRGWLSDRIPAKFDDLAVFIGLETNGKIVVCVCYEDFNKASVKCHIAIDGRINKEFLWYMFHYPFEEMKVKKIIALIDSFNVKSLKFYNSFRIYYRMYY